MMSNAMQELRQLHQRLATFLKSEEVATAQETVTRLASAVEDIGRVWSGSWIGYQSRVYYDGLRPPPPGAHFSSEWGLYGPGRADGWQEFDIDFIRSAVFTRAGLTNLSKEEALAKEASDLFEEARAETQSILESSRQTEADTFLQSLQESVSKLKIDSVSVHLRHLRPSKILSRDSLAISQGFQAPPHLMISAEIGHINGAIEACRSLSRAVLQAASHLERTARQVRQLDRIGTNVFIGHGRSVLWRELKDFVQDRLRLPWDEFNRVPVAGITNIARLSEMLDSAAIALLVMTAEDELADGSVRARMNVVHEAGLFQGRLGFTKAIVLLEEGCEEFSNIQGLGQIRFPAGQISAAFEQVRQVLEREGVIPG